MQRRRGSNEEEAGLSDNQSGGIQTQYQRIHGKTSATPKPTSQDHNGEKEK
jgi:hypothetical protein